MTLGERIAKVRKSINPKMSQEAFAQSLGKSRAAYAMYEIDRVIPDDSFIQLLCSTYNVNRSWIEEEIGDMLTTPPPSGLPAEVQAILGHDNPFAVAVISALLQMPKPWWEAWEAEYDRVIGRTEEQKEDNG